MNKLLQYLLCMFFSTFIMLFVTYFYTRFVEHGVLFFNAFFIAFLCSLAGLALWCIKNREKFEAFLVLMTYVMFNILFIYFGPVTLDRSLSSFVYFYAVENSKITRDIFDEDYFSEYIQRRFNDGENIGYLKCDEEFCYPTAKTKFTYYVLFPLGKLSGTLENFEEFKNMVKKRD